MPSRCAGCSVGREGPPAFDRADAAAWPNSGRGGWDLAGAAGCWSLFGRDFGRWDSCKAANGWTKATLPDHADSSHDRRDVQHPPQLILRSSYCPRSKEFALRAEMIRMTSSWIPHLFLAERIPCAQRSPISPRSSCLHSVREVQRLVRQPAAFSSPLVRLLRSS